MNSIRITNFLLLIIAVKELSTTIIPDAQADYSNASQNVAVYGCFKKTNLSTCVDVIVLVDESGKLITSN